MFEKHRGQHGGKVNEVRIDTSMPLYVPCFKELIFPPGEEENKKE